jgi:hypothetical protein
MNPSETILELLPADREELLSAMRSLVNQGVELDIQTGGTVMEFLEEQLGLAPDYVEKRIQTVFLNGKPVDRMDRAALREGSVLGLSAALPGLLGASLRMAGPYSSLRSSITYQDEDSGASGPPGSGRITLKAFNVLLPEITPVLAERGFLVKRPLLAGWLKREAERIKRSVAAAELDGKPAAPGELHIRSWDGPGEVMLRMKQKRAEAPALD